jgi:hypothetical protein
VSPNSDLAIVIASKPCLPFTVLGTGAAWRQGNNLVFFNEIGTYLAAARDGRMGKGFQFQIGI